MRFHGVPYKHRCSTYRRPRARTGKDDFWCNRALAAARVAGSCARQAPITVRPFPRQGRRRSSYNEVRLHSALGYLRPVDYYRADRGASMKRGG